jgi:hypothetical protein
VDTALLRLRIVVGPGYGQTLTNLAVAAPVGLPQTEAA